jgi:hypothetical protein
MNDDREPTTYPAITGHARWVTPDPATVLRAGRTATLWIQPEGKKGELYSVEQVARDGVVVAYRIGREQAGAEKLYTVTLGSQSEEGTLLFCSCRDAHYRIRQGKGGGSACKHAQSIRAGLSAIGLLPTERTPHADGNESTDGGSTGPHSDGIGG